MCRYCGAIDEGKRMPRVLIIDDSPTEIFKISEISRDPDTSGIPVIIVTTKDQETDRLWGQRQGAKGYLTKPIDSKGLLKAIDAVLN